MHATMQVCQVFGTVMMQVCDVLGTVIEFQLTAQIRQHCQVTMTGFQMAAQTR